MNVEANKIVDHFFRHESGRIISFLTNRFGADRLELVEDAVQEAFIKAMQVWPFGGIPDNPSAWVLSVSRNKILDQLRREQAFENKSSELKSTNENVVEDEIIDDDDLNDDLLKMMFACCHPAISNESQIILVLKILCGFSMNEISRALLKSHDAVAKAYGRAKTKLKTSTNKLEVPYGRELDSRLDMVLKIIYLLFNEGYSSASSEHLVRKDLCFEAMRLTKLMLDNKLLRKPKAHALMALMCFQSSRFETRFDDNGRLLTLKEQNRNLWDHELIQQGSRHMALSTAFGSISEYHIQASIAACHSMAESFEETNWEQILELYDALLKITPNEIIGLNRIVAFAEVFGPDMALEELKKIESAKLKNYYLFYAIKASLYEKKHENKLAIKCLDTALELTQNNAEKEYLDNKIKMLAN